jgi:hypothetical protein
MSLFGQEPDSYERRTNHSKGPESATATDCCIMRDNRTRIGELTYYSGLDDLSKADAPKKIAWFRGRFKKVIVRPLMAVKRIGVHDQAIWDLNLGVVTIICSAIEALGSFYSPGAKDKAAFNEFVTAFMEPVYQGKSASGMTYAEILYGQFRCGMAHGFTIEGHEVATRPGNYIVDDDGYVSIDLWTLFDDMRRAFDRFINEVERNKRTRARFIERFDKVFINPYKK